MPHYARTDRHSVRSRTDGQATDDSRAAVVLVRTRAIALAGDRQPDPHRHAVLAQVALRIHVDEASEIVDVGDADGREIHRRGEALLAVAQALEAQSMNPAGAN